MTTPLQRTVIQLLEDLVPSDDHPYTVPGAWVGTTHPVVFRSGAEYLLHQLTHIRTMAMNGGSRLYDHASMEGLVVYSASVRHVTSYDHGAACGHGGWRSTGTFMKLVALLPYLLEQGVTTISLLPITEIGVIGRKGTLGSPYAVKHPLHLDPMLAEPKIALSIEDQARLCVEMCHHVGIRVLVEGVLRTASLDSDLVAQHPEWFYWIDEERVAADGGFRAPEFHAEDITRLHDMVEHKIFRQLPSPPPTYTNQFAPPPWRLERDGHGWKGFGAYERIVRIPPAFADWPVDDPQPAWSDVTYLKLHDHPRFNYMAYNTIRMYDAELDQEDYRRTSLWNTIAAIIPTMMRMLNLDGTTIDMGHALPKDLAREVIGSLRRIRPDALVISESFVPDASEDAKMYDAVVGFLPLLEPSVEAVWQMIRDYAVAAPAQYVFATPETHNTPRACSAWGSVAHGQGLWLFLQGLPRTVCVLHAGMELGETTPVNTGLGFSEEERLQWEPHDLPLFSDAPLRWDHATPAEFIHRFRAFRALDVVSRFSTFDTIDALEDNAAVPAYIRWVEKCSRGVLFCWNATLQPVTWTCVLPARVQAVAVHKDVHWTPPTLTVTLQPGETMVLAILGVRQQTLFATAEHS